MNKLKTVFTLLNNKICTIRGKLYSARLILGKGVSFKRFPNILIDKAAKIEIGNGTIINSSNFGYHINMFAKCKLYADRPGARIRIGSKTRIHGSCVHAYSEILIGNNCLIAANSQIIDGNGHLLSFDQPDNRIHTKDEETPIVIENNVWIAANCIILGGTKIGEGSIITAGNVVKGKVPSRCIYGGNPAKLIKQY